MKDTDQDDDHGTRIGSMPNDDDDPDQYRLPQGSLFVEIQSLRNHRVPADSTLPAAPTSLYETTVNGGVQIDLAKRPNHTIVNPIYGQQPIWRFGHQRRAARGLDFDTKRTVA